MNRGLTGARRFIRPRRRGWGPAGGGLAGAGLLWPVLLVAVLVVFSTVDADGDPMTANTPAVLTSATVEQESDGGVRERDRVTEPAPRPIRPRHPLRRLARAWVPGLRSAWQSRTGPIRGP